jgi:CubicO group peptidase (beta-lactamase class C family)
MKLIEDGRLSLDDKIFGAEGILNDSIFSEIRDERALQITVKNLLEHSGGWTTKWGDPMFMGRAIADSRKAPMPVGVDEIICFVLSKRMHFNVGSFSSYVNVGYVMLGRVIEKVTGMTYEDYVRGELLTPMGIADMRIGNSYPKDFYSDEVSYYDVWDAKPAVAFDNPSVEVVKCNGGYDIRALGAAGGWVASPAQLVRFALCIDGSSTVPDILLSESVDKMVRNESGFDPLGWRLVSARRWLRTGTLAGTSATLVRDTLDYCWAFVTNTSSWKGSTFSFRMEAMINGVIARESPKWEGFDHDLFTGRKVFIPDSITSNPAKNVHLQP